MIKNKLKRIGSRLKKEIINYIDRISIPKSSIYPAVIVLGNQKCGTSAIAHLIADYGGLTKAIDLPPLWGNTARKIISGEVTLKKVVYKNPRLFSRQLIKEPSMTFMFNQLNDLFPNSTYIFIVRNPYENIRSILDRLNLPGNYDQLPPEVLEAVPPNWKLTITGATFGEIYSHYIEALANRWNRAINVYLNNRENMILVKYEEFLTVKAAYIERLATKIGINKVNDISNKVDIQFQPKGKGVDPVLFFGRKNNQIIETNCSEKAKLLGY